MKKEGTSTSPERFEKKECLRRAEEFRKAAEIFRKMGNIEIAEDCLDNAVLEETMAQRGPLGNLLIPDIVRA